MTTNQLRKLRKDNPGLFWDKIYAKVSSEFPTVFRWIIESTPYAVEALQREFDPQVPLSQYVMPLDTSGDVYNFVWSVHWLAHNEEQTRNPIPVMVAYYPMPRESWFALLILSDDKGNLNMEVFPPHYFKQYAERKTRFTASHLSDDMLKDFAAPDVKKWLQEWDWDKKAKHRIPAFEDSEAPKQFSKVILTDLQCLDYYLVSDFLHFNQYVYSEHNPLAMANRCRMQVADAADSTARQWVSVWPYGVSFSEELGERVMMHKTYVSMPMLMPDQVTALLPAIREVWHDAFHACPQQYLPLHQLDDTALKDILKDL